MKPERAILVGLSDDTLPELAQLAKSAGAEAVATCHQNLNQPHPATYIGKGKAQEVAALVAELAADVVICDDELSPAQVRHLEEITQVKVIDRTQLILDIFAQRARTHEGRLQVELAQLSYLLPRLIGLGQVLSRLGGGIGTRGPGETKLETDRRRLRRRIAHIRAEIDRVRKTRQVQRRGRRRSQLPVVALVGYTNAGKSTLFNALTGAGVSSEDRLFATLDPTIRRVELAGGGRAVLLSDTVGFIRKLPHQLVAAFRATLEEVTEADALLHVVDASHPQADAQITAVESVLDQLKALTKPTVVALNKLDKVTDIAALPVRPGAVAISALTGAGLLELKQAIGKCLPT